MRNKLIVTVWMSAAFVTSAAQPDYFPLQVGNQWLLQTASPAAELLNIEVLRSRMRNGNTYFLVSGYAPEPLWLRQTPDGTLLALDEKSGAEQKVADLAAGRPDYNTTLSGCEQSAAADSAPAPHRGPNFDFETALTVSYAPLGCRDIGILHEVYAAGTGLVRRSITTLRGELVFDLVFARVNGTAVSGKSKELVLLYDFNTGSKGWLPGFSDYDAQASDLQFLTELRPLPDEVDPNRSGFFIQSMNRSDDVFMFLKKQVSSREGIEPNRVYRVSFDIRLSSNAPSGCAGIGGSPGEGVFLKAGASTEEPLALLTGAGAVATSIDKGQQAAGGRDAGIVGTIANGRQCDGLSWPYVSMTKTYTHQYAVRTDERAALWLVTGTDSGFEGLTGLYFQSILVRISPTLDLRRGPRR